MCKAAKLYDADIMDRQFDSYVCKVERTCVCFTMATGLHPKVNTFQVQLPVLAKLTDPFLQTVPDFSAVASGACWHEEAECHSPRSAAESSAS